MCLLIFKRVWRHLQPASLRHKPTGCGARSSEPQPVAREALATGVRSARAWILVRAACHHQPVIVDQTRHPDEAGPIGGQRRQSRRTGGGDQPNDSDEVIRRGIGVVRPACGFRPSRLVAGVSVPPPGRPYPSQGRHPLRGGEIRAGDELASGSDGCTIQRRCIGGSVVRLCDVVKMFSFISAATAHICRKGRRTRFYRVHPGTVRTIIVYIMYTPGSYM